MDWEVLIALEGTPANIQLIADAVELAFPGVIGWQDEAVASSTAGRIRLTGIGFESNARFDDDHTLAA